MNSANFVFTLKIPKRKVHFKYLDDALKKKKWYVDVGQLLQL